MLRVIGWILGAGLVIVLGLGLWLTRTYVEPAVDPAWAVPGSSTIPEGSVTVRYTGTATLVFSDGDTTWMVDGWFSRPGPLQARRPTTPPTGASPA